MSVVIDGTKGLTSTGGYYASTTFTGTYTDGIVVDYATGLGRISVGASDGLAFYNGGVASTELMRIDSSGNVGIGTSSILGRFSVTKAGDDTVAKFAGTTYSVTLSSSASESGAKVEAADPTGIGSYQPLITNGSIQILKTGGTERARIDSSGNLLLGTTSSNPIASRVNGWATGPVGFVTQRASNNMALGLSGTSVGHIAFYTDNGSTYVAAGNISSNGATTAYNATSDYRLKENVTPLSNALSRVAQLKPVKWTWKEGHGGTKPECEGFIAHELQEVIPVAVTGEKDAVDSEGKPVYQGIDTSFLVATLTAAIQEQQAIIQQLQADVAALKGQA